MGTRGNTVVIVNGETKIHQYGQWDHYPSGQGLDALRFLRDSGKLSQLRENSAKLREATDEDYAARDRDAGVVVPDSGFVSFDVAKKLAAAAPHLDRDMAAGILEYVADGKTDHVALDFDLMGIEGTYTVDFDKGTFRSQFYETDVSFPLYDLPSDDEYLAATNEDEDEDED